MNKCYLLLCYVLLSTLFLSCSDTKDIEQPVEAPPISLSLTGDENLEGLMDKIVAYMTYESNIEAKINTLLPKEVRKMPKDDEFAPVMYKTYEISQMFAQAYRENKTHTIQGATLEKAFALAKEWEMLCASAKPYMQLSTLAKLDNMLKIYLSLLFLNYNNGDTSYIDALLNQQYESAKGTGELNAVIESHIQMRLLILFALYHLDSMQQNTQEHLASRDLRTALEADLARYKDFLPKEHYELYDRTFVLLNQEALKEQAPMDRIFNKLLAYLQQVDISLEKNVDRYLHIERAKNAYELSKTKDFNNPTAQEIIQISHNPLKNIYDSQIVANYLYGLDYLSLALLNDNLIANLPLALDFLQKDFKFYQITQHRFEQSTFQNYIASLFLGAYILSNTAQNQEYFDELLRLIKAELSQYSDMIAPNDMDLYNDALTILEQTDRAIFSRINLAESKPKDEPGYIKVLLNLSPQEMQQIDMLLTQEVNMEGELCLSPLEVDFLLSLAYQAYKAQGFKGVAPEMFKIRLDEVLNIENLPDNLKKHLIDFDNFLLVGATNKRCFVQELVSDEALSLLRERQKICGENLYLSKENGFILSHILPSLTLERVANGNIYFRLKEADLNLNKFMFHNDENALQALIRAQDTGDILSILLAFFPDMKSYLNTRLSPQDAQILISKSQPKPCE
ncbi:hypothetical protein LS71_006900 [Helicobacter jaachi]|uniref:Uncharacterized protein n=1 Tax=Helicobacter jaachi TaxID=1677920 RepID=A0A4V6I2H2_9HELI|nr:hypothetical protein [Helicobacter jaachi]TLD96192.1 hypothetical protein LS71_006900 [Helicobacter jaachi]